MCITICVFLYCEIYLKKTNLSRWDDFDIENVLAMATEANRSQEEKI